jgi:hypothetical protein
MKRGFSRSSQPSSRLALAIAVLACACTTAATAAAVNGRAYLGCHDLARLLYLKGVEGTTPTKHDHSSMHACFERCRQSGHAFSLLSTDYRCWCALAIPDVGARVDEAQCAAGAKKGVLVFYLHQLSGSDMACRIQHLPLEPGTFGLDTYSTREGVVFDATGESLALQSRGNASAAVEVAVPPQQHGVYEVVARAAANASVVTAIEVR